MSDPFLGLRFSATPLLKLIWMIFLWSLLVRLLWEDYQVSVFGNSGKSLRGIVQDDGVGKPRLQNLDLQVRGIALNPSKPSASIMLLDKRHKDRQEDKISDEASKP